MIVEEQGNRSKVTPYCNRVPSLHFMKGDSVMGSFSQKVVHVVGYMRFRLGRWEAVCSHHRSLPK